MLPKISSVLALPVIIIAEVATWYYIEIGFDGCCGAPGNFSNDGVQSLSHLGAYALGVVLIVFVLRWGWKKRT